MPESERLIALTGGTAEDNRWHVRKDGSRFWAQGVLTALRNAQGDFLGFVKLARDMTGQKFREEELQRAKEAAEVANEAKGQFLAIMSHELRTPLGAMIGFADALLDTELPIDKRLEYADTIRSSGQRLATIINDILDLSKVEAGRLEVERHDFPVREIVREIELLLGTQAQDKNLKLNFRTGSAFPNVIRSDPCRLRQILINIIGNAIKFTNSGYVDVIISSRPPVGEDNGLILFTVNDSGPGIAEPVQKLLFQPFIQADSSISRRFGGTGLGLALSRRIAKALGGDVTLEFSEEGKGSSFAVSVDVGNPCLKQAMTELDDELPRSRPRSRIPANSPLCGIKALVVDDAPENRLLIRHILRKGGCSHVDTAEDGEIGLKAVETEDYDVIIMDMQMPKMDGFEATAALRRKGCEKPIIALTAHAMPEEKERCLNVGCDDFLVKPIEMEKLFDAVLRHTAASRLPRPGH